MRTFVAVDVPDRLADDLAAARAPFADAAGLRLADPEAAHVTLKFIGEVDPGDLDPLADAVADADAGPFTVELGGLGVFPSLDYISVVWVGVREGARELTRLHAAIEDRTVALGVDPADHEFTPHVTLARMDDARGKGLVRSAVRERKPTVGRFTAREVRLVESTLTPDGPEYEAVERFALSA
jgi:2'-5' RNA ligase